MIFDRPSYNIIHVPAVRRVRRADEIRYTKCFLNRRYRRDGEKRLLLLLKVITHQNYTDGSRI